MNINYKVKKEVNYSFNNNYLNDLDNIYNLQAQYLCKLNFKSDHEQKSLLTKFQVIMYFINLPADGLMIQQTTLLVI